MVSDLLLPLVSVFLMHYFPSSPFSALMKIIRSHQILLDRLREARVAVGTAGFNMTVHRDFASKVLLL